MGKQIVWSFIFSIAMIGFMSCSSDTKEGKKEQTQEQRKYTLERVGPARVVQVYADGFDQLSPKEKIFGYYLNCAAIAGRDIAIDQHHPSALEVRELFEQAFTHSQGIDSTVLQKITKYLKLFWINNGFYDSYTSTKVVPECTFEEFTTACATAQKSGASFNLNGESLDQKLNRLRSIIFDPSFQSTMTNKTPGAEWIKGSAVNFYGDNLTYKEVESWAKTGHEKYPLNSKVVKENGKIVEKVWRAGGNGVEPGMYADDLGAVIKYLELAIPYASSDYQAETVRLLVKYFKTGEEEDFRKYNIHWVKDSSAVDFILGFIEVYLDPRAQKAEWEASIFYTDPEQTKMMQNLARYAQYFEANAPWKEEYKANIERSPIANVINTIIETGGTGPISPIGINLPNEQAIRQQYGSKSVLLHNIVEANEKSSGKDLLNEFAYDQEEIDHQDAYGSRADNLHTAMHEVIGHGSGKVSEKLNGKDPADFLPGYYNTLEEARADLVALWNAWDDKIVDIGIAKDKTEARKIGETMYQQAIRVSLAQLRRLGPSKDQLEEDHMKNRQLIAHYIIKNSDAVKVETRNGKTYYRIIDYDKAREAAGKLLAEIMRIKAEGDLAAARNLVDTYGLKVDPTLRDEVLERVGKLNIASYNGFVQPHLEPAMNPEAKIVDVKVSYPFDLAKQMIEFSTFTKNEKAAARTRSSIAAH
ncbi:MAG: peptidase M49 [Ignavibacteriae bacterium]|nr:peptidase M49 [Ignavibacteria bacterium]MBI3365846.1 peptidase M49 [Ignavibacteriota bacterium]